MASRSEPSPSRHDDNNVAQSASQSNIENTTTARDEAVVVQSGNVIDVDEVESDSGSVTPTAPLSGNSLPLRGDNSRSSSFQARSLRRTRVVGSLRAASSSMGIIEVEGSDDFRGIGEDTVTTPVAEPVGENIRALEQGGVVDANITLAGGNSNVAALATRPVPNAEFEVEEDRELPGYGAAVFGGDNRELIDDLPQDDDNVRAMQIALRHTETALENLERLDHGQLAAEERFVLVRQVRDSLRLVQDYGINAFRGTYDQLEDERHRRRHSEQAHAVVMETSRLTQQQYDLIEGQFNAEQQRAQQMEEAFFNSARVAQGLRDRMQALEQENRGFRRQLVNIAQGIINVQQAGDVLRNDALAALRINMPRIPGIPAHAAPGGIGLPYGGAPPGPGQALERNGQAGEDNAAAEIAAAARAGIPVTAWRALLAHRAAMEHAPDGA